MIQIYESVNTFNSHFRSRQNVNNGDTFNSSQLNNFRGVSASRDITLTIDNSIPLGQYRIIDVNGDRIKNY